MNTTNPVASRQAQSIHDVLTASARIETILALVRWQGFQTIDSLAQQFGVTPQTIRRDANHLCNRGLCRRRHGGIDLPAVGENVAYTARQVLNSSAKRRIATCVAAQVPDGASLFFGIGTTPEYCAQALTEHHRLQVMTNNINVAISLSRNPECDITLAGGRLRNLDCDVVAGEAHDFFKRFAADIGIYGVGGVAEDGSLLDFSVDEVRMREELAQHCRQRFLVLDNSKFSRAATVRGGHISEADVVFTDQAVPAAIAAQLESAGVRLVIAPPAGRTLLPPAPLNPAPFSMKE